MWGNVFSKLRNRLAVQRAEKLIFITGNKGSMQGGDDLEVAMQLQGGDDEYAGCM